MEGLRRSTKEYVGGPRWRRDRVLAPPGTPGNTSGVSGRNWKRLAGYVRSRRVELGFGSTRQLATAVGISERTIGNLERGVSVGTSTLAAIENLLGWAPGSAETILAGGEPAMTNRRQAGSEPAPALDESIAQNATQLMVLRASLDELRRVANLIDGVRGPDEAESFLRDALALRERAARSAEVNAARLRGHAG